MFDAMISEIREDTVRMLLSVVPRKTEMKRVEVAKATSEGFAGAAQQQPAAPRPNAGAQRPSAGGEAPKAVPVKKGVKVGRNDPCPCGSGKKYKKCCGMNDTEE
ncbi:MAG: SEC-C domain-containing protein [Clostridia bacterium]|nr:SEC-C domain-containing protein [Clostridia bacterium]